MVARAGRIMEPWFAALARPTAAVLSAAVQKDEEIARPSIEDPEEQRRTMLTLSVREYDTADVPAVFG